MTTWISSRVFCIAVLGFVLTGCGNTGNGPFGLFSGGSERSNSADDTAASRVDQSLAQATLASGALALVPPDGFCVDKRGLRDNFAVLARCDSLGGTGSVLEAPLGMILVSTTPTTEDVPVGRLLPQTLGPEVQVLERFGEDDLALAHVLGGAPSGVDPVYWRGMTQVNGHLVSFSAFAPRGGALATAEGGRVLASLAQRMTDSSSQVAETTIADAAKPQRRGRLRDRIGGLFNRKAFIE